MPLSSDPDARFDFWLKTDAAKPAETRPTFIGRFLTRREWNRIMAMETEAEQARNEKRYDDMAALRDPALAIGLVGWRNMTDPDGKPVLFAEERDAAGNKTIPALDELLTNGEKIDLLAELMNAAHVSESERKKSFSPLLAESEKSADSAAAA